jgi:hypothetical protein
VLFDFLLFIAVVHIIWAYIVKAKFKVFIFLLIFQYQASTGWTVLDVSAFRIIIIIPWTVRKKVCLTEHRDFTKYDLISDKIKLFDWIIFLEENSELLNVHQMIIHLDKNLNIYSFLIVLVPNPRRKCPLLLRFWYLGWLSFVLDKNFIFFVIRDFQTVLFSLHFDMDIISQVVFLLSFRLRIL